MSQIQHDTHLNENINHGLKPQILFNAADYYAKYRELNLTCHAGITDYIKNTYKNTL